MEASDLSREETGSGLKAAIAAYTAWGLLPVYWKLMVNVPSLGILSHRIIWSLVFVAMIMIFQGRRRDMAVAFRSPRRAALLSLSSLFIAANWLIYIWAVNADKVLETSLGYYINPLVTVFFGFVFFREKMERVQWLAISIASVGVLFQVIRYGRFPWVALGLALSFAFYGLIRKKVVIDSLPGLFAETAFLSIPALLFLLVAGVRYRGAFLAGNPVQDILLVSTGAVTSLPLLWFAYGARRLKLTTLGFLQYIAPTLTFFLGVSVFREPLDMPKVVTFVCIWVALGLYSWGSFAASRREQGALATVSDPGTGIKR
ncbi:MAG: EamA family transporter RarD [Thermovirgaceae bacterium]|jgi:chloramphenicol-sensitive protein RarD|nr:EamA family transporter RarD [Synergistales bacterium]NLV64766.1 EamA family transporter RarD [Synergistaceae bacterium]HRW87284.1 EamA family transporter RarD [Thermovirgaceae bacterium]MDD3133356.1 EamA family transporter RarD [Synergistales bacterium]MDD3830628.1 EamA family transporter RarD [Synergistales bacterium]